VNSQKLESLLDSLGACEEAVVWTRGKSLEEAWTNCERADWMLWLCGRMVGREGWPTREQIGLAACLCAESVLPLFEKKYPNDDRPRKAIEAARAWAQSGGEIEEVRKARRAAAAADADALWAAAAADADALWAAAAAGWAAAAAGWAAAAAGWAAAAAAADALWAAAAAGWAAAAAARAKHLKELAEIVRKELVIPIGKVSARGGS
jgi:hypothetical protein